MPIFVAALQPVSSCSVQAGPNCRPTTPSRLTQHALCVCAQLRELIEAEEEGGWPDFVLKALQQKKKVDGVT